MSEDIFHLGIKALIRNSEGKILLLRVNPEALNGPKRDYWDLPGGRVQKGHTVIETLKREVAEETGIIEITNPHSLGMVLANIRIPLDNSESAGLILGVYTCDVPAAPHIILSNEHIAYHWYTPKEAADLLHVKYPKDFCQLIAAL